MDDWTTVEVDGVGSVPVVVAAPWAADERVLLVRDGDGVLHATAASCPHLGNPLTDARLEGRTLECSHHCYTYDLVDGGCVEPGGPLAGRLAVHDVRETRGVVELRRGGQR